MEEEKRGILINEEIDSACNKIEDTIIKEHKTLEAQQKKVMRLGANIELAGGIINGPFSEEKKEELIKEILEDVEKIARGE
jgi:hypothetical protein